MLWVKQHNTEQNTSRGIYTLGYTMCISTFTIADFKKQQAVTQSSALDLKKRPSEAKTKSKRRDRKEPFSG